LAINAWAKRSEGAVVPAGKIVLGFVALVALDQVARVIAAANLGVGGFMSLGWIDLYHFAFIPLMFQIIFFEKGGEEAPFREYLRSEVAVVKSLASGACKECRA